jgi:hypothetical protein
MPARVEFDQAVAEEILDAIINGVPLRRVLKRVQIHPTTFGRWCRENEDFGGAYADAKDLLMNLLGDDLDGLADKAIREAKKCADPKLASAIVQGYRIKIDTRKWTMSKLSRRYADRTTHVGDPKNPIPIQVEDVRDAIRAKLSGGSNPTPAEQ